MKVSQASKIWLDYHRAHSKHNTIRAYKFTITKFNQNYAELNLNEVSTDDILDFMTNFTEGLKPQTKRVRFSHLNAFFNFMGNNFDGNFKNPCDSPMLPKLFQPKANVHWDNIENYTEADDFSNLLWSSQSNGWKSRQIGWNKIKAT